MASKKKVEKTDVKKNLRDLAVAHLLGAHEDITKMKEEMSPNARISWRERASVKLAFVNAVANLLGPVK